MLGSYHLPLDLHISFECLDFLNSCLRFDSFKRKDFQTLCTHPFVASPYQTEVNSTIYETSKPHSCRMPATGFAGVLMNTRDS